MATTTAAADVIIVGAGPAGAALGCFLAQNGVKALIVSKASSPSATARSHILNLATMECLRDIGLEEKATRTGTPEEGHAVNYRFLTTFAGQELMRDLSFGNDPHRKGDYWEASPCKYLDLPQHLLEPLLLNYAETHGCDVRFNVEYLSFEDRGDSVKVNLYDHVLQHDFSLQCKYLAGADGGRSRVAKDLGLDFVDKGSGGLALNIHYRADLTHLVADNPGLLHFCFGDAWDNPGFPLCAINLMRKPWTEWTLILMAKPGYERIEASLEEQVNYIHHFLGYEPPDLEITGMGPWKLNEEYASGAIAKGNVFCLGDAIHRHPPANGLGSNTCIQDAYNLAWKMAYALQGRAGRKLLDSYGPERQPVAERIVTRANDTFRLHFDFWKTLGMFEERAEDRAKVLAELRGGTSPDARARRVELRRKHVAMKVEHQALGVEMNVQYLADGVGVCRSDEKGDAPKFDKDMDFHYQEGTYPGFHLPHAWLVKQGQRRLLSTHDLCGRGSFTLLTGIGGKDVWTRAVSSVLEELRKEHRKIEIKVHSIGMGQDYEDVYWMWEKKREVDEDGAVLLRPDRFVAWRCKSSETGAEACGKKLFDAMSKVLCLDH